MSELGPHLEAAMRNAAVTDPDARGLMPLAEARALVRETDVYEKGEGRTIDGVHVLESDWVWAAFLSLEDADEMVREGCRIEWRFQVRGMENLSLVERYDAGVLPWIADAIDDEGVLTNVPWCRLPCLLALEGADAFAVAARAHAASEGGRSPLARWVLHHPEPGWRLLAEGAADDEHMERTLRELAEKDPGGVRHALQRSGSADEWMETLGLDQPLPAEVTAVLESATSVAVASGPPVSLIAIDDSFAEFECPMWENANYFTAGMRVMGFVHPGGDALVFQSLVSGLGTNDIRIELVAYGPHFAPKMMTRWHQEVLVSEEALASWNDDESALVHHTTGVEERDDGSFVSPEGGARTTFAFELRGERVELPVCIPDGLPERFGPIEAVMLQLVTGEERLWQSAAQLLASVGLPPDMTLLFTFDGWDHPFEAASESLDFVAMLEALRQRRAITELPSGADRLAGLRGRLENLGGWGDPRLFGQGAASR